MFWILIGIIGAVLIALIINHDQGTVLGIENESLAYFAFMSVWVVLIGTAVFHRGQRLTDILRNLVIWVAAFLVLMSLYVFRYDLQDLGSRLSGGLLPGSPISRTSEAGRQQVTIIRSPNGHFEADGVINGAPVRFLVDTGASNVVLTMSDAEKVGIDTSQLNFTIATQTANGRGRAARAGVQSLNIGSIRRSSFPVLVIHNQNLGKSLLGQDFLESLYSYEKRADRLTLTD